MSNIMTEKMTPNQAMYWIEKYYRRRKAEGETQASVAAKIGVSTTQLNQIIRWRMASRRIIKIVMDFIENAERQGAA